MSKTTDPQRLFPGCRIITSAPDETSRLGKYLAAGLFPGAVLLLTGPMGSGKTTFVKGLAAGLGLKDAAQEVISPSFVLVREYPGLIPLYHADLYRLESLPDVDGALLREYFESGGVTAVEWADKFPEFFPIRCLHIAFDYAGLTRRAIACNARGDFRLKSSKNTVSTTRQKKKRKQR